MRAKILHDFDTKSEIVVINSKIDDPRDSSTNLSQIRFAEKKKIVQVIKSDMFVDVTEIGLPPSLAKELNVKDEDIVSLIPRSKPKSFDIIKKKYEIQENHHVIWSKGDIQSIIEDIYQGNLTDLELASFVLAMQYESLSKTETVYLTESFAHYGTKIDFGSLQVYDKHSIGGIPGNKVSLIIVPIVAAAGLLIPKTSSRAITSPSGTADTMEVLANVTFTPEEIQEIAPKTKGMIVWTGKLNLVPVDAEIIEKVERPLRLDPESVIIASILSKKLATGVKHLVLDLPTGPGTKVETRQDALNLSYAFVDIGRRVGIEIECALTYADQPVGHAIGPALEAREAIVSLQGNGPRSVREKSVELSGILIEMARIVPRGQGAAFANSILNDKKALTKFAEIVEAQGGNSKLDLDEIPIGKYQHEIVAKKDGYIAKISNKAIKQIASALGCPIDKSSGMVLLKKAGEFVKKETPLIRLYSNREVNIDIALKLYDQLELFQFEGMVLERVGSSTIETEVNQKSLDVQRDEY
jgi:AMP phosphorylase